MCETDGQKVAKAIRFLQDGFMEARGIIKEDMANSKLNLSEVYNMSKFDSKEDMIDYLVEEFEESEDICIVANREIATIFMDIYNDESEFDLYSIELSSENDVYYISKSEDDYFIIEPAIRNKEYIETEADEILIVTEGIVLHGELFAALKGDIEYVYYISDDYGTEHECTCHGDCCNCYYDEHDEVKLSEFEKLNDAQKDYLFTELSDIEEINLDEIAKICMTFYNDGVNSTLLKTRLLLSELEK